MKRGNGASRARGPVSVVCDGPDPVPIMEFSFAHCSAMDRIITRF